MTLISMNAERNLSSLSLENGDKANVVMTY